MDITKSVFKSYINADGNFKFYLLKSNISDYQIITLVVSAEAIGIDSENNLFGEFKRNYRDNLPNYLKACFKRYQALPPD
ncbi:hypothetical protein [Mucilaginibacter sp.]|uniref:hypothetical protein n=1 Tax=Mucilaginibacter sp. TaxID=1882438 RepID=UPI00260AA989|nr:hypothetical protein [Mucilaginibacter sp.]